MFNKNTKKFFPKSIERAITDINITMSLIEKIDIKLLTVEETFKLKTLIYCLKEVPIVPPKVFKCIRENELFLSELIATKSKQVKNV